MPVPGHWSSASFKVGVQTIAHCVGELDPEVSRLHCPAMPPGVDGHFLMKTPLHLGEQNDPMMPVFARLLRRLHKYHC